MAGPPQLRDPGSPKQFSEATEPDTTTADAIEALGSIGIFGFSEFQKSKLRGEVSEQRENFLNLTEKGVDPNDPVLDPAASGEDLVNIDIPTVIEDARRGGPTSVTGDFAEVTQMATELANVKRGVAQGVTPIRALELNTEAILRRYIDRYPGLANEFQKVAQVALGTENNLLTATMRTFDEMQRAAEAAQTDQERLVDALSERFPLVKFGATEQVRSRALTQGLTILENERQLAVLNSQSELNAARGEPTIAQENFNNRMRILDSNILTQYENGIMSSLPPELQNEGIFNLGASIKAIPTEERLEVVARLEAAKAVALQSVNRFIERNSGLSQTDQQVLSNRLEFVGTLYDNAIESVQLGRLNDALAAEVSIIQNTNLREFEMVLGRHALVVEKLISLLPPGSSVINRYFNARAQQPLGNDMLRFLGITSQRTVLESLGHDPDERDNKELIDTFNIATVDALRDAVFNPENPNVQKGFDPVSGLKAIDIEFAEAPPEVKRKMLDLLGEEEFVEFFNQQDAPTRATIKSIAQQTAEWGGLLTNRFTEEMLRDISSPLMARQFQIKPEGGFGFRPPQEGDSERTGPILVQDVVNLTIDERGLRASRKDVNELINLGIAVDAENLANIQRMVAVLNNQLITGMNSYARAISKLDEGADREQIVREAIAQVSGAPDVPRNEE